MPRKKPTKSSDLEPMGEGILTGIHYDPFEPSVYGLEGLIPEFINLASLANWTSGPKILEGNLFKVSNPEDRPVIWAVTLSVDSLLAQFQLASAAKREYYQSFLKDGKLQAFFNLEPGESKSFKALGSTYGGTLEVQGQIIFEAKFNV